MTTTGPGDQRTTAQRMEAGDRRRPDEEIIERSHRACDLRTGHHTTTSHQEPLRRVPLEQLPGGIGEGTARRPSLHVDYGRTITIGGDVQIGPSVQLLTPTHPVVPALRRTRWESASPIVIEGDIWLDGGAIGLAGVRTGSESVVVAGTMVTRDLPAGVVAVGSSAHVAREVTDTHRTHSGSDGPRR